jgi:hypothetical protein
MAIDLSESRTIKRQMLVGIWRCLGLLAQISKQIAETMQKEVVL